MNDALSIECFGHAAFSLTTADGDTLLIDPHAPGLFGGAMDYPPIKTSQNHINGVICTHEHLDHCAIDAIDQGAEFKDVFDINKTSSWHNWTIERIRADHDEYNGHTRGGQVDMLRLQNGPWSIVHLSDVGQSPSLDMITRLHRPDILIVPVGGFYTIGAAQAWAWCQRLDARCIVPMHFKTPFCSLPLLESSVFLSYVQSYIHAGSTLKLSHTSTLPSCALMLVDSI